jgi:Na+/H+ antiporter NhaD/arsenite permease-like protein
LCRFRRRGAAGGHDGTGTRGICGGGRALDLTLAIFLLTYAGIAIGRVPGFKVDRTGVALIGAIGMLVAGKIAPDAAWASISFQTMALLFGLMVLSAAFAVSGFYDWLAHRMAGLPLKPPVLLALLIVVAAVLSAVLSNAVVVVSMVPLILQVALTRGLNPLPLLLGFCFAANNGSAATLIGSPQNMIVGQQFHRSFIEFIAAAGVPAVASLAVIWLVIVWLYRGRWQAKGPAAAPPVPPTLNRLETSKALFVAAAVIGCFLLTGWPPELIALGAAAVLLINRTIASSDLLGKVDGDLLLLVAGLSVVNAALAATGMPHRWIEALASHGVSLASALPLYLTMAVVSDIVGNTAAALMVVPYVTDMEPQLATAAMALGAGLSGNAIVFGSLPGIFLAQSAQNHGVPISFGEFSRAGIPVTIASLAIGAVWLLWLG